MNSNQIKVIRKAHTAESSSNSSPSKRQQLLDRRRNLLRSYKQIGAEIKEIEDKLKEAS